MTMSLPDLRQRYHEQIVRMIIRTRDVDGMVVPNFADISSRTSRTVAAHIAHRMGRGQLIACRVDGQTAGRLFEAATVEFIKAAFGALEHLRPGEWHYSCTHAITASHQYEHLADLDEIIKQKTQLASSLGLDYIVSPDILGSRSPVSDEEIYARGRYVVEGERAGRLSPLRAGNPGSRPVLHASVSCKWTLRSDRGQNARTEAANLVRNRKGPLPHVVVVTAEPMPTRIASLALGTGDIDCLYHMALYELEAALRHLDNKDQLEMFLTMVEGRRMRDISDLPLDLAT